MLGKFIGQSWGRGGGEAGLRGLFDGDGAAAPDGGLQDRGPGQEVIGHLSEERALGVSGDALDPITAKAYVTYRQRLLTNRHAQP